MEFLSLGLNKSMGSIPIGFLPSRESGLKLWHRFNSGITETGLGVSQWDDVSGNDNHSKQGTDLDRPQKQANGSILCDGISQFLKTDPFTFAQPELIFILGRQVTWTVNDTIFDGNTSNSGRLFQQNITPHVGCYAGDFGAIATDLIIDTNSVISVLFDHDNTLNSIQINNNTPSTDAAFGTSDMGGLTLGANGGATNFSNFQFMEVIAYDEPKDAATLAQIINYLARVGGLSI